MADALQRGRDSYRRRAWAEAYSWLSRADLACSLGANDLELLGTAAFLIGRDVDSEWVFERAHHAQAAAGDHVRAARSASWLALCVLLRGEMGRPSGWLARARRLLGSSDCVEQGFLLLPVAEQALAEGDAVAAYDAATLAVGIGHRFGDADVVACACHLQGRALIGQQHTKRGLALLDEAMLAVTGGELSPILNGLIYCSVIETCQEVHALSRAREWSSALSRWCAAQPELVAFTAACLVRRAEVLQVHGDWPAALSEANRACERSREANRKAPGAAFYQQAEIHRLRGDFVAAEEAYRRANQSGCEAQPGLALLRLAQGRTDAARAAIRPAVKAATDRCQRAALLPAYIDVLLAAGNVQEARQVCRELGELADTIDTDAMHARAAHGRGAVELAEGDAVAAVRSLRRAFHVWEQVEVPYASACVRMLIGIACRVLGDEETAALEFASARAAFQQLGAAPSLARLDVLEQRELATERALLTRRELQVLRLVAAGNTNKAIAAVLALSERTIDRHVGNILTKLDVPSRAAATACAYRRNLL